MPRLIDADALADELAVLLERNTKLIDEWLANLITDAVDDAPTVDAETVRHGRWIKMRDRDGAYWACSECGEDIPRIAIYDSRYSNMRLITIDKTKFCPNCGAKMQGDNDG